MSFCILHYNQRSRVVKALVVTSIGMTYSTQVYNLLNEMIYICSLIVYSVRMVVVVILLTLKEITFGSGVRLLFRSSNTRDVEYRAVERYSQVSDISTGESIGVR